MPTRFGPWITVSEGEFINLDTGAKVQYTGTYATTVAVFTVGGMRLEFLGLEADALYAFLVYQSCDLITWHKTHNLLADEGLVPATGGVA